MSSEVLAKIRSAQSKLYAQCGLQVKNFLSEKESSEYYAHTFTLENKHCLFRIAKKTSKKTGWFVTLWKRGSDHLIAPYDMADAIDFAVIAVLDHEKMGEFIFPKKLLLSKKILSEDGKGGKRAIRVYTPWDETLNGQSIETQKWQSQFFVNLGSPHPDPAVSINHLHRILNINQ